MEMLTVVVKDMKKVVLKGHMSVGYWVPKLGTLRAVSMVSSKG
jgi:hypothetical protein